MAKPFESYLKRRSFRPSKFGRAPGLGTIFNRAYTRYTPKAVQKKINQGGTLTKNQFNKLPQGVKDGLKRGSSIIVESGKNSIDKASILAPGLGGKTKAIKKVSSKLVPLSSRVINQINWPGVKGLSKSQVKNIKAGLTSKFKTKPITTKKTTVTKPKTTVTKPKTTVTKPKTQLQNSRASFLTKINQAKARVKAKTKKKTQARTKYSRDNQEDLLRRSNIINPGSKVSVLTPSKVGKVTAVAVSSIPIVETIVKPKTITAPAPATTDLPKMPKAPAQPKAPAIPKAPAQPKAPPTPKAPPKAPPTPKAPPKAPPTPKAPAKPKAPAQPKAPAPAKVPNPGPGPGPGPQPGPGPGPQPGKPPKTPPPPGTPGKKPPPPKTPPPPPPGTPGKTAPPPPGTPGKKPPPAILKLSGKKIKGKIKNNQDKATPDRVGWKQGKNYISVNLVDKKIKYSSKKQGIFRNIKPGDKPKETFTVLESTAKIPKIKKLNLGKFTVNIKPNKLDFQKNNSNLFPFKRITKINKLKHRG